jgi:hypothetical protein
VSNAVVLDTPLLCLLAAAAALVFGILEVAVGIWAMKRLQRRKEREQ